VHDERGDARRSIERGVKTPGVRMRVRG